MPPAPFSPLRMLNRFIMATIGRWVLTVNPREKMPSYFVGKPFEVRSLRLTRQWLLFNAAVHGFLIVVCAAIGWFFMQKGYTGGVVIILLAILLNVALILVQVMNRIRIGKLVGKLNKRTKTRRFNPTIFQSKTINQISDYPG